MKNKNEIDAINIEIEKLLVLQAFQQHEFENQINLTLVELSPFNFIKNTLQDVIAIPDLKENIVSSSIGLVTGYISKKILIGATNNPIKKLLGNLFQLGVTNFMFKHSDDLKTVSETILEKVFNQRSTNKL